jgi:predicted HTH domain antitoxin
MMFGDRKDWRDRNGDQVVFPEELLIALKMEPETFRKQALVYTLGKLYETGQISGGLGAQILGCARWEFYRLLSENGFAVIDYPPEDLEQEAETSRQLAERIRSR